MANSDDDAEVSDLLGEDYSSISDDDADEEMARAIEAGDLFCAMVPDTDVAIVYSVNDEDHTITVHRIMSPEEESDG
jgi:hypothetical protein